MRPKFNAVNLLHSK